MAGNPMMLKSLISTGAYGSKSRCGGFANFFRVSDGERTGGGGFSDH
jgi:hypothetical protein